MYPKPAFILILFFLSVRSGAQTGNVTKAEKLIFSVASYNKKITHDSEIVFILKIRNNSPKTQYIPLEYYCSVQNGMYGNVEYEVMYCSPDTGTKYIVRRPLLGNGYNEIEKDSIPLKPYRQFVFQAEEILKDYFYRAGAYKIRFYFVEKTPYYITIPGLKTDWVYFDVGPDVF